MKTVNISLQKKSVFFKERKKYLVFLYLQFPEFERLPVFVLNGWNKFIIEFIHGLFTLFACKNIYHVNHGCPEFFAEGCGNPQIHFEGIMNTWYFQRLSFFLCDTEVASASRISHLPVFLSKTTQEILLISIFSKIDLTNEMLSIENYK